MYLDQIRQLANAQIKTDSRVDGRTSSSYFIVEFENPTEFEATIYDPVLCLILQGEKETVVGEQRIKIAEGELLIVSHELPVASRITKANPSYPYRALILPINMDIVRSLYAKLIDNRPGEQNRGFSLEVDTADNRLMDALCRYLELQDRPEDIPVLEPLILQEIHFRLLQAPNGATLYQLLLRDSHASRIAKAISVIRQEYKNPLSVPDLARVAGMSQSSFHQRFKSIIGTSPLQYQKELRLIEAQKLLMQGQTSVAGAAYEVGYESPAQFSREYTRKFNKTPVQHLSRERVAT